MKRYIVFALALLLILTLSGCVKVPRKWEFLHSADSISAIEIYNLAESVDGDIPEDAEPIAFVKQEDFASFCEDISKIQFSNLIILVPVTYDPSWSLGGYVAKIIYENGDYEIICNRGYQAHEVKNGRDRSFHYNFPDDSTWNNLIESYMDIN